MKKFLSLILLISMGMMVQAATCDTWPFINQNEFNWRSNDCEKILNPSTVPNLKLQWFMPGANPAASAVQGAPIIVNGVVYYGDSGGFFYARDAVTGLNVLSPFSVTGSIDAPASFSNGIVYFTFVPAGSTPTPLQLYALNASDFSVVPGFPVNVGGSPSSMPTCDNTTADILAGVVVAGAANDILIVGVTDNGNETQSLLQPARGGLVAFNLDGSVKWTLVVNEPPLGTGAGVWSTAGVDNNLGLIFVGTANANTPPAGPFTDALLAIDYNTGAIKWSYQFTKDDVYSTIYACGHDWDLGASPNLFTICHDGKKIDVVGVNNKAGCYRVFERATGKPVWQSRTIPKDASPSTNGNSGAAYSNGIIYTQTNVNHSQEPVGVLAILAEYSGKTEALLHFLEQSHFQDTTVIRAHCAKTGKIKWSITQEPPTSFPSITEANGVLYTGNFLGLLRAYNAADGSLLFQNTAQPGTIVTGPISVVGGRVYISLAPFGAPAGGLAMYSL